VGRRSTLGMRAQCSGSPEISGSCCTTGDAGEEERKGERGADRWGWAVSRKGGESAGWLEQGDGLSAGGGGGPSGAGHMREREGEWAAGGKGSRPKGKKRSRPGCLGWSALYQIFSYLLF
jgi:hypothetical protein